VLRSLTLQLVDAYGNAAAPAPGAAAMEVQLCPLAKRAHEGEGEGEDAGGAAGAEAPPPATVAPASGKATRRLDGQGGVTFGDVRLCAPGPGRYVLRAKVAPPRSAAAAAAPAPAAIACATMALAVAPTNRVSEVQLTLLRQAGAQEAEEEAEEEEDKDAPGDAEAVTTVAAGGALRCRVVLVTEDGLAPPPEAAEGLTVWLVPPPPDTADVAWPTPPSGPIPLTALPAAAGGGDGGDGAPLRFCSEALRCAGAYTLRAEFRETRRALTATASAAERRPVAAPPRRVQVAPGPAAALRLVMLPPDASLAVANGGAEEARLLLRRAVLALTDAHGNKATPPPGGAVTACIVWPGGDAGGARAAGGARPPAGASLPSLEGDARDLTRRFAPATGHVTFKPLTLAPGSGALPTPGGGGGGGGSATALRCALRFSAAPGDFTLDVPVAMTDRAAQLAELNAAAKAAADAAAAERAAEAERKGAKAALEHAKRARDSAAQRVCAAAQRAGVPQRAPRDMVAARLAEAEAAAQRAAAAAAGAVRAPPRASKRGAASQRNAGASVPASLEACLSSRTPDVLGAAADLAYVEDAALCRALSWNLGARMLTCVVRQRGAMQALRAKLRAGRWHDAPICSFLSLDMVAASKAGIMTLPEALRHYAVDGEAPQCAARRAAWLRAALAGGCDTHLRLGMPHLADGKGADAAPVAGLTPRGLLGHAVNLLRPSVPGLRRSVWHALLSNALVFEDLACATEYKAALAARNWGCPTLITLDGERIQSNGVTDGGRPPPARLEDMEYYFGSAPTAAGAGDAGGGGGADDDGGGGGGDAGAEDEEVEALRALMAECDARAKAEAAYTRAKQAADAADAAAVTAPRAPGASKRAAAAAAAAAAGAGGGGGGDDDDDEASPPRPAQRHKTAGCATPLPLHACCPLCSC
jgi:hypothetical protein